MKYFSVCSGIEAATVAWEPLGWKPVAFSELEAFPSAVLAHHYPSAKTYIPEVAHTLRGEGFDASEDGTGRGTPLVATALRMRSGCEGGGKGALLSREARLTLATANDQVLFVNARQDPTVDVELAQPLDASSPQAGAIAFTQNQAGDVLTGDVAPALGTNANATGRNTAKTLNGHVVRRLTPKECERLQGFPDDYTQIPWRKKLGNNCPDGPRYKALGNSMAVPVMRWVGERIARAVALMEKPDCDLDAAQKENVDAPGQGSLFG